MVERSDTTEWVLPRALHPERMPATFLIRPAHLDFGLLKKEYKIGTVISPGLKDQKNAFNTFSADKPKAEIILGLFLSPNSTHQQRKPTIASSTTSKKAGECLFAGLRIVLPKDCID